MHGQKVVGGAGQIFCGGNQVLQTGSVFSLSSGFDVISGQGIVQAVHNAFTGLGFQLFQ